MKNIEIKVECDDLDRVCQSALESGATDVGTFEQIDTFFSVPKGRLKLRQEGSAGRLIAYERTDRAELRISSFDNVELEEPGKALVVLRRVLPVIGVVRKTRHLLILHSTRIHLDVVESLGSFVELETIVTTQSLAEAQAEAELVAKTLGVDKMRAVPVAYIDLLDEHLLPNKRTKGGDSGH
jgi:adenylate cyclase class IV